MKKGINMEKTVIWGAGRAALKRCAWAVFFKREVICFVDNDAAKWGKTIQGVPVHSPDILKGNRWTVVVPDLYKKEIEAQLNEISYQGRILGFEEFRRNALIRKEADFEIPGAEQDDSNKKIAFIFDSYFTGVNWGGVESWSCMVAKQLQELGVDTSLLCGENKKFDEYVRNCVHFSTADEVGAVKEMAAKIIALLPCVFITHGSIALYAAQIVRSMYPKQIKIVAVAHGDESNTYERLQLWSEQMDKIICISNKIQKELQEQYGVRKDILLYRPNPIIITIQTGRRIDHDGRLQIGFAARLRREQKRVHLLPEIIEECLQKKLDVEFNIAGEGECLELLRKYVSERHVESRVHILGWIAPTEMAEFWGRQDIYLNISDFEGMSLAMLEAMSQGCVPVVTDVSGVSDLIEDGKNGFVVSVDHWLAAAGKIEMLDENREILQDAGNYNMALIREKYDVCDYAKWLTETFNF